MNQKLIDAVIRHIGGKENAEAYFPDVCKHGASGGFNGFIYYKDTFYFWKRYKLLILEYAEEMAKELGEEMLVMVQNFNAIKGDYSVTEIGKALYSGLYSVRENDEHIPIYNVMAWFALEEVARDYCDKKGI